MIKKIGFLCAMILMFGAYCQESEDVRKVYSIGNKKMDQEITPEFLYKIVTKEQWEKSQGKETLLLDNNDTPFIHLATESQVPAIAKKFFKETPYVILKLSTKGLKGRLVLEINPGGTTKYYHLYEGSIPLNSVLEVSSQSI